MLNTLHNVFEDTIRDLYSAESQIARALPRMAKAVSTPELKKAFERHLEVTQKQIDRLLEVCESTGIKPKGKKCVGMEGLLKEGEEILRESGSGVSKDAALIVAAQKVEHYEIVGYGSARTFAERLGYRKAARLLQKTLDEESRTDEKLTAIAERNVNREAEEVGGRGAAGRGRRRLPLAPEGRTRRGADVGWLEGSPGISHPMTVGTSEEDQKGTIRTDEVRSVPARAAEKSAGQARELRRLQELKRTASPEEVTEAGRAARETRRTPVSKTRSRKSR